MKKLFEYFAIAVIISSLSAICVVAQQGPPMSGGSPGPTGATGPSGPSGPTGPTGPGGGLTCSGCTANTIPKSNGTNLTNSTITDVPTIGVTIASGLIIDDISGANGGTSLGFSPDISGGQFIGFSSPFESAAFSAGWIELYPGGSAGNELDLTASNAIGSGLTGLRCDSNDYAPGGHPGFCYANGGGTLGLGILGTSSGFASIVSPAAAGTPTLTLPTVSGTFLTNATKGAVFATTTVSASAPAVVGCTDTTVAVASSTTAMTVVVSPQTNPNGAGVVTWAGYISTAGTADVRVCAITVDTTPPATTYNVTVLN